MKTFLELNQKYETTYSELVTTLDGFVTWLVALPEKYNLDVEELKWDAGYNESYSNHYIDGTYIHISLEYIDSYDCNSYSCIRVPLKWIDSFYKGDKELLEKEVIQEYINYDQELLDAEKKSVRLRAIELGLIKE
jgi:hypothetical protein